ncbi:MAG TPA: hypothetical protein VFA68_11930 [Terriglobales bacterium]|nr:hypothetical protein [Terriglobales bacterium]
MNFITWYDARNLASTLLLAGIAVLQANAQANVVVTRLNPAGSSYTTAAGLNNIGTVVGAFELPGQQLEGFSYDVNNKKYTTFSAPGALYTIALGVNDFKTIVGTFTTPDNIAHGFFLNGSTFTQYDVAGSSGTEIHGVNDAGNFSGTVGSNGFYQGFINIGGTVTQFTAHGRPTVAYGINNTNSVVGFFVNATATATHGFLRGPGGVLTQIDVPGSTSTACTSINDAGVITGFYSDSNGATHSFILNNSNYRTTTFPYIAQINNLGAIVGSTASKSGQTVGFLAAQ